MIPVIVLSPCDELQLVVEDLNALRVEGALPALPRSYREDLDTLKSLCGNIPEETALNLAALESLPEEK